MDIKNLAFQFLGCCTDESRLEIIQRLGNNPWKHAQFAHYLTNLIGAGHDWLCYRDLMVKLYKE